METTMTKAGLKTITNRVDETLPEIPDAELIAAGVEFRILQGLLHKAERLSQPHWNAQKAAKDSGRFEGLGDKAFFEELKRIEELVPLPVPCCDDITDAIGPLLDKITALPATTIEGLAAKACIVGWSYGGPSFSDEFDGCLWDEDGSTIRSLVEAVLALAGRSPQAGATV
jgi:hypothetical protein